MSDDGRVLWSSLPRGRYKMSLVSDSMPPADYMVFPEGYTHPKRKMEAALESLLERQRSKGIEPPAEYIEQAKACIAWPGKWEEGNGVTDQPNIPGSTVAE